MGSCKREPVVVGKPSDFMLKNIAAQYKLAPEQICMVGDRLDTDVMFGKNGGLTTCLVLTGWGSWRGRAHHLPGAQESWGKGAHHVPGAHGLGYGHK